jgi:hypothetical protein
MILLMANDSLLLPISQETIIKDAFMTRSPMTSSKRLGNRAPSILPPMPYYEKIRQETPAPK